MNYPEDIRKICIDSKNELVEMVEKKQIPFDFSYINNYIMKYFDLLFEKKEAEKAEE